MKTIHKYLFITARDTKKKVVKTKFFQSLDLASKNLLISRINLKAINDSLKRIEEKGYEQWFIDTNSNINNIKIIKEIINE